MATLEKELKDILEDLERKIDDQGIRQKLVSAWHRHHEYHKNYREYRPPNESDYEKIFTCPLRANLPSRFMQKLKNTVPFANSTDRISVEYPVFEHFMGDGLDSDSHPIIGAIVRAKVPSSANIAQDDRSFLGKFFLPPPQDKFVWTIDVLTREYLVVIKNELGHGYNTGAYMGGDNSWEPSSYEARPIMETSAEFIQCMLKRTLDELAPFLKKHKQGGLDEIKRSVKEL